MRNLSAGLLAVQRRGGLPAFVVEVRDKPVESERLQFGDVFAGGTEQPHDACVTSSGAVLRVRNNGGTLQTARVVDPTAAGQWDAWTALESSADAGSHPGIGADPAAAEAAIAYARSGTVYVRVSTDHGASWGAEAAIGAHAVGATPHGLAVDVKADGTRAVVLVEETSATVIRVRLWTYSGGTWTAHGQHPTSFVRSGTAGTRHPPAACWNALGQVRVVLGDGPIAGTAPARLVTAYWDGSWQEPAEIFAAGLDSGFEWRYPALLTSQQTGLRHWLTWVGISGDGAATRTTLASSWAEARWVDWLPVDNVATPATRVKWLRRMQDGHWYLVGGTWAMRCPYWQRAAPQYVDVASRVRRIKLVDPGGQRPSSLLVELRNEDGGLNAAGTAGGAYQALRAGSEVALGLGYHLDGTPGSDEVSFFPPFWIESVVRRRNQRGESWVELRCIDGWGWLDRIRAKREIQLGWPGSPVTGEDVATWLCSYVSGTLTDFGSPRLQTELAAFVVPAGETIGSALRRLSAALGVVFRFYRSQVQSSTEPARVQAVSLAPGDAATYSYGDGAHPIREIQWGSGGLGANDVALYGSGAYGEARDFPAIELQGRSLLVKASDQKMTTGGAANGEASRRLEEAQRERDRGSIEAPVNVGQELYDVVEVTDASLGVSAVRRRVSGLEVEFDAKKSVYGSRLELGQT